uniref:Leucine-rich repeat protein n=1 Tax=Paramoeba aestuarina TaxID=180227 RepID=A0A7S4UM28_9EUKA|mmetsp:Transcript_39498/g.62449  ORF Transcript_39498/g.62449 Transcript_39498/m.62449 type:complete len:288 (+) Transcript_39498:23-886(+)
MPSGMPMTLLHLINADPESLGRLEYTMMSQQSLMELLIDGFESKSVACGRAKTTRDLSEGKGVTLTESGDVDSIVWNECQLSGKIDLQWLPPTVTEFRMRNNRIKGTVSCEMLPESLVFFTVNSNKLIGSLDLTRLPKTLQQLYAASNRLSGSLNLENLPITLVGLALWGNNFSGSVCLTKLPQTLISLSMDQNKLSGTIDLTKLPSGIQSVYLSKNEFAGETDFRFLPDSLRRLEIEFCTELSGNFYRTPALKHTTFARANTQTKIINRKLAIENMLRDRDSEKHE